MEPAPAARCALADLLPAPPMRILSSIRVVGHTANSRWRATLGLTALALVSPVAAFAQLGTVAGVVVKAGVLAPVEGAAVRVQ